MVKCNSTTLAAVTISVALIIGLTFSYTFFFPKEDDTFFIKPAKSEPQAPQLYSVHIVSWNVAGKKPTQKLLPLLGINDTFKPDFVVVGIQETVVAKFSLKYLMHTSKWPDTIELELEPYGYQRVDAVQNKAMDLMVYVKSEHAKKLEQFESVSKSNYLQIKGGLSIRFDLNWKKIAFTNSHLPAGETENSEREKQYNEIKDKPFTHSGYLSNHDYHFWFGDLNFRLKHESPEYALKVINSIKESTDPELRKKDLEILLHKDQLKISQKNGRAFSDYEEPEINFIPTYKFFENTFSDYDLSRMPSYCDRILTKKLEQPNNNLEITNVYYEPKFQFTMSDHRPVTALFYIKA